MLTRIAGALRDIEPQVGIGMKIWLIANDLHAAQIAGCCNKSRVFNPHYIPDHKAACLWCIIELTTNSCLLVIAGNGMLLTPLSSKAASKINATLDPPWESILEEWWTAGTECSDLLTNKMSASCMQCLRLKPKKLTCLYGDNGMLIQSNEIYVMSCSLIGLLNSLHSAFKVWSI